MNEGFDADFDTLLAEVELNLKIDKELHEEDVYNGIEFANDRCTNRKNSFNKINFNNPQEPT